jgi:syntaxin-binding protein 1
MSELLEENVHLVENITMKQPNGDYLRRQPLKAMTAVYFLTPTVESVNRLIADYRDKRNPMYGACHLFFSSRLSDALLAKIKASPVIGVVAGFKEINLELACIESNAFVLDSPQSLPRLFAPDETPAATEAKLQEQHRLAAMIATLCTTLGEMPHIRYSAARPVSSSVAAILQQKLVELSKPGSSFPTRNLSDAERPTLLIVDRSHDPLSPLLHEFTYQGMVNDVLSVQDDRYRYNYVGNKGQKLSKEVLLNETDPLWTRLRDLHIADLGTLLHAEYKQFVSEHPEAAKLAKQGGEKELKTMTEGLRGMPKFQETSARYSLHMALTQELMKRFQEANLETVATLEQNMATGEDAQGKGFRTALPDLRALLERTDLMLSPEDKIRLLMIYVITQEGIRQDERRQLNQLAGISPEDQVAILNLFYLNVTLLQGTAKKRQASKRGGGGDQGYDVSRYVPPLKRYLEELLTSGLSAAEFPFVTPPESMLSAVAGSDSARKGKGKGSTAGSGGDAVAAGGRRLLVFVLGGLSYSELRGVHEVGRALGREIIVGSTSMLTPQTYLLALKQMKQLDVTGPI